MTLFHENAKLANSFDMALFNLMERASHIASVDPTYRTEWDEIARKLAGVRPNVRTMMNDADREATL